jgi:hypothetical protein
MQEGKQNVKYTFLLPQNKHVNTLRSEQCPDVCMNSGAISLTVRWARKPTHLFIPHLDWHRTTYEQNNATSSEYITLLYHKHKQGRACGGFPNFSHDLSCLFSLTYKDPKLFTSRDKCKGCRKKHAQFRPDINKEVDTAQGCCAS